MKTHPLSPTIAFSPSFALISVLALVSLAALTATAFLASARLERQATMPLTQTTMLEMALNTGVNAAKEMLDYAPSKHFNFVTTYWRGANNNDWTNELGYLLSGAVQLTNNQTSCIVNYYCCFSTSKMTNLGTSANELIVISNNVTDQGSFFSQMSSFMATQTNFLAGQSTNIPLLGDTPSNRHTSPPVGWVYIKQDVRVKPGSTNTTNVPVARFAFFVQDLCGMIDAERMGGLINNTPYRDSTALPVGYNLGTNPAEISLTNLTDTVLTNAAKVSNLVSANNRMKYLSPGMLVLTNGGGLNTNDLRYVTTGLRHWTNAYERIPIGLGYPRSWEIKTQLKDVNFTNTNYTIPPPPGSPSSAIPTTNTNFILFISNNLPQFAARSGAMNSNLYLTTLAANIADYVDANPNPTVIGSAVGYDNYPLPVVFSDQIAWSTNSNPSNSTITVTTYIQFWNCSTLTSPAVTYTLQNNFQDTYLKSNGATSNIRLFANNLNNSLSVPALAPNQVIILTTTNTNNVGTNAEVPGGLMIGQNLGINNNLSQGYANYTDLFELRLPSGVIISKHNGFYNRIGQMIPNGSYDFEGTCLTMSRTNTAGIAPIGDPRMLRFLSNSAAIPLEYRSSKSGNLKWGGYANFFNHPTNTNVWNGHPDNWPDGRKSTLASASGLGQTTGPGGSLPYKVGIPITLLGTAPAILSTNGTFLNIWELGNIFDPIQWKPPATFTANSMYYNCSINTAWTTNGAELYGGGTTLRIGRAEHQRFAWTNQGGVALDTPNMQMSSAALLDMFCVTNQFDESGQINLNTAPAPVLRALAGGIRLTNDPAQLPPNVKVPQGMAEAFAQGVMRFRAKYPFYSPSQLAFISTDPAWPNTTTWPVNAVFGNTNTISLATNSVNKLTSTSIGITDWNDQATEEWFAKIFNLTTTYSRNYRVYVIAQKATNQGNNLIGVGPVVRKYYNVCTRQNTDNITNVPAASTSTLNTYEASY